MADERSLRQKLQAMADQTASPEEAEVARYLLAKLSETGSGRVLTRDEILGAPDRKTQGRTMTFRTSKGTVYTIDMDEYDVVFVKDIREPWPFSPS